MSPGNTVIWMAHVFGYVHSVLLAVGFSWDLLIWKNHKIYSLMIFIKIFDVRV